MADNMYKVMGMSTTFCNGECQQSRKYEIMVPRSGKPDKKCLLILFFNPLTYLVFIYLFVIVIVVEFILTYLEI